MAHIGAWARDPLGSDASWDAGSPVRLSGAIIEVRHPTDTTHTAAGTVSSTSAATATASTASPELAARRAVGGAPSGQPVADSPLRGLIVHDDPAVQRAIAVIMERCGFQVMGVAGFPDDSIPAARATRPDAVVLDLALSGDLGLGVIPAFLATAPACMVVVLSPFTGLREQARELGAFGLVDPRDLRHVEDWLLLGTDPEHPCR